MGKGSKAMASKVPDHVAAYAAGIWSASAPHFTWIKIAGAINGAGFGEFDPKDIEQAAIDWVQRNVPADALHLAFGLRRPEEPDA